MSRIPRRLTKKDDFTDLFRRGRRMSSVIFTVYVRPSPEAHNRFAFVVGHKVDRRAVVRNRLRSRMREYVRSHQTGFKEGLDIALVCKKGAAEVGRKRLYEELEAILARLGHFYS